MSKDAVATMGGLLPEDAWGRDAVHVAVFSAFSADKLFPGQDIAVVNEEGGKDVRVSANGAYIGIVDPFLKSAVPPGERFWVYLYPRTITALSHRWSHPAFEATNTVYAVPAAKIDSEVWLRRFCQESDCPSYEEVMGKAASYVDGASGGSWGDDEYLHFNDTDAHGEIPPEFWEHVQVVLGRKISDGRQRPTYFSCSC